MRIIQRPFETERDGLTIRGTVYSPTAQGKFPVAILSHGFMSNEQSVKLYAKRLAKQGYAAFTFDFCGGCGKGRSDGRTEDMTVFTEVLDLCAVMDHAAGQPFTQKGSVTLMGCSQGGFVSALAAAQRPDKVKQLILFFPALCIPDDARRGKMMLAEFDPQNIPETLPSGQVTLGRDYAASVLEMDAVESIRSYPGPVLIVHGTKDPIVDLSYAEKAAGAYANAKLVVIENAGHGFYWKADRIADNAVTDFLKTSTPG